MKTKQTQVWKAVCAAVVLSLLAAACAGDDAGTADGDGTDTTREVELSQSSDRLQAVLDAGVVKCGTRDALPGFAVLGEDGEYTGFDSDFCRAIAAAVLGDAEAVDMVPLETADRFTALQSGEIDVLVRNTTWTATRDGSEAASFAATTLYDGQTMMVKEDSGFGSMEDMDNTTICLVEGTTTQLNLTGEYERRDITLTEALSFADTDLVQEAFVADRCDGWTSDATQLLSLRSTYPESEGGPEALVIFDDVFSKEPLGPAVSDGDTGWFDAVNWAIFATIQAEEFGITSANVDDFLDSDNPDIRRFLGQPEEEGGAEPDPGLGLPADFAYQVISQVGNYAEIFEEHLTPLGLERGINALWTDGGILYAPPYR
ncbi:MAG TPA: amino acid ABC transporter substrate-binding protein [Acidimicrobiales bacterium]|nr:amino acid ABC transporter substrate-binding protein [Acidimicrobiales bacterium]